MSAVRVGNSGLPRGRLVLVSTLFVDPGPDDSLRKRMVALGITEADLEEHFVRSGGHGGQNVNKVSTCVVLLHRPSGVQVKCQTTRHQGQNRALARAQLLDKIEAQRTAAAAAERARREKARRAKRGRSRGAKQRMLADKSKQADKKAQRRRPPMD